MAISRYERTLPILDVGKRSEAVVLQLEVPIGVIEGLSSLLSWHCALVKVAGESLSSIRASRAGNLDGEGKAKIVDEQMDEGRKRLAVVRYILGQELQGHETVKAGILSFVDNAHATATQLF
jgi:hypothetical protein